MLAKNEEVNYTQYTLKHNSYIHIA